MADLLQGYLSGAILKGKGSFREQAANVAGVLAAPAKFIVGALSGNEEEKRLWKELAAARAAGDLPGAGSIYDKTLAKLDEMTTVEAVGLGAQNTLPGSMLRVTAPVRQASRPDKTVKHVAEKEYLKALNPFGPSPTDKEILRSAEKVLAKDAEFLMEQKPWRPEHHDKGLGTHQFNSYADAWQAANALGKEAKYSPKLDRWVVIEPDAVAKAGNAPDPAKFLAPHYTEAGTYKDYLKGMKAAAPQPSKSDFDIIKSPAIRRNAPKFDQSWPELLEARGILSQVERAPAAPPGAYKYYDKASGPYGSSVQDPSFPLPMREEIARKIESVKPRLSTEDSSSGYSSDDYASFLVHALSREDASMALPQAFRGRSGTLEGSAPPKIWTPDWVNYLKHDPSKIIEPTAKEIVNAGVPNISTARQMAEHGIIPANHWTRKPIEFGKNFRTKDWNPGRDSPFEVVGTHAGSPQAAQSRASVSPSEREYRGSKARTFPFLLDMSDPYLLSGLVPSENMLKTALNLKSFLGSGSTENPRVVRQALEKEGYSAIPYVNDVEDMGSMSFIVPSPRRVTQWPTEFNPTVQGYFNP